MLCRVLHERIYCIDIPWAQHLEGSYFPREILRYPAHKNEQLWYLDHGSHALIQSDHCNTNLVRWVVRENGVTLAGPSPATLVNPIPVETLRKDILATIHDWGQEIIAHPDPYNNRFYQDLYRLELLSHGTRPLQRIPRLQAGRS